MPKQSFLYHIRWNFGDNFNLTIWQIGSISPNLNATSVHSFICCTEQSAKLKIITSKFICIKTLNFQLANISTYTVYHMWIQSLLVYVNGCGTSENNIRGHYFFWSGTCEFTNIIIVTKKCKKNFVILQSIGIIAIKSRETRSVICTYRYSSGQFNP